MSGFLSSLLTNYQRQMERQRNRPFLRAAMATCALAATADGEITFAERIRVDQVLDTLDALKIFDPHDGVELFNEFSAGILDAPQTGRERALEAVNAVLTDSPDTANLLVRICLAVAEARGEKGLIEQIEIVMLCSTLGVELADAGLYTDAAGKLLPDSPVA